MSPFILHRSSSLADSRQPTADSLLNCLADSRQPTADSIYPADSRQPTADSRRPRRRAFTLVELLMVIIIIGLLMGLLIAAVGRAVTTGKESRVIAELAQMDAALKEFQTKYGALPPANHTSGNSAVVTAFLRRAWPRIGASPTFADLDPAEVFVYYLGGVSNETNTAVTSSKVTGFNLNPTNPTGNGTANRSRPLFDFDQSRLRDVDDDNYWEYYPPGSDLPYVYFDHTSYGYNPYSSSANILKNATTPATTKLPCSTHGYAMPYLSGSSASVNADSFQIISAGIDGLYGGSSAVRRSFPGCSGDDADNLTNFSSRRLEDGP